MVEELRERLRQISFDPRDPFFAQLKKRVGESEAAYYEPSLRNLVLVIPEMLTQIRAWIDDPGMSAATRRLYGHLLTYVFHPQDRIPDGQGGLFGYLDDAFLVALSYRWVLGEWRALRGCEPFDPGLAEQVPVWLQHVREVIPKETVELEAVWSAIRDGNPGAFEEGLVAWAGAKRR